MKLRNLILSSALAFLTACGTGGVGQPCTADGECGEYKCLYDKRFSNTDNMCINVPGEGTCSPVCRTHADCAKFGSTFKCALAQHDISCNPTGICLDDYKITCNPGPCREAPAN